MRKLGVLLTFIFFIGALIAGYIHWNAKVEKTVSRNIDVSVSDEPSDSLANQNNSNGNTFTISRDELKELVMGLPEPVSNQFLTHYEKGEPLDIIIVGSPALASETNGWSVQVKEHLEELYGDDFLKMTIVEFDGTSTEFVDSEEAASVVEAKPDIVFFEPLTLEDNGLVEIDTSHENIKTFMERILAENPEAVLILQPPHPIHAAVYYPRQVEALAEFAEEEGIPYFDHWPNWPDPDSDEITNYLNEDGFPNENGHKIWADAVINYFTGKNK